MQHEDLSVQILLWLHVGLPGRTSQIHLVSPKKWTENLNVKIRSVSDKQFTPPFLNLSYFEQHRDVKIAVIQSKSSCECTCLIVTWLEEAQD